MMRNSVFMIIICGLTFFNQPRAAGQDKIELGIFSSLQSQLGQTQVEQAQGFGVGARMNFPLVPPVKFFLDVHYDYLWLSEEKALEIWEWDYWEDTYIDFIPGAEVDEINRTRVYNSSDSIYAARFVPRQHLKELRLAAGLEFRRRLHAKINFSVGLNGGVSLFYRTLQMQEHWTKRFKIDPQSTSKFDYEFQYDLLHFAPTKKGTKIFFAPEVGTQIFLSDALDFNLKVQYLTYLNRDQLFGLALSANGVKWSPLKSKVLVAAGLTFKY